MHGREVVYRGQQIFNVTAGGVWEIGLLVFPLEVRITDFILNTPVKAMVLLYDLYGNEGMPLYVAEAPTGVAYFPKVPRGDYKIVIDGGGLSLPTPIIFRRLTVEHVKVITPSIFLIICPMGGLILASAVFLKKKPNYRRKILVAWSIFIMFAVLFTQIIAEVFSRELVSISAIPIYSKDEKLIGFKIDIYNKYFAPVILTYHGSDVEIKIYNGTILWTATYESPDFHDIEMGELKVITIPTGCTSYFLALYPIDEQWNIQAEHPLPPGNYYVFIRVYGISPPMIIVNIKSEFPQRTREKGGHEVDIPYQAEP